MSEVFKTSIDNLIKGDIENIPVFIPDNKAILNKFNCLLMLQEQYQKEIYLIGAYNRVWTTEVSYSNEEVKTYFTVSSSGTLALDRDVNV